MQGPENDTIHLLLQSEKKLRANLKVKRKIAAVCERMRNKHFVMLRPTDERQHKAKYKKPVTATQENLLLFEVEKVACSRSEKEQIAVCDHMHLPCGTNNHSAAFMELILRYVLYRYDEKCRDCMKTIDRI